MKRNFFSKFMAVALLLALAAQSGFAQKNVTKQVLHRLGHGEVIYNDEYYVSTAGNTIRLALITHNPKTDRYAFILNGERVAVTRATYRDVPFYFVNLDATKDYGYEMLYYASTDDKEGYFISKGGVEEGPFDAIRDYDESGYSYQLAGRWYRKVGNRITGPFVGGAPAYITKSGSYIFDFKENGQNFVNVNGIVSGPFVSILTPMITTLGKYGYVFTLNEGVYVNVNGQVWGPYDEAASLVMSEGGRFAFNYKIDGSWFVNANGHVWGPYLAAYEPSVTESGSYVFMYKDYERTKSGKAKKNTEKYYFNINGKVGSPYAESSSLVLTESGNYMFMYKENGNWFANINDKVFGPYTDYADQVLTESGKFAFIYTENGRRFANVNDKVWGPFAYVDAPALTESGKFAFRFKDDNQYFININGQVFGPYVDAHFPAITDAGGFSFLYNINDGNWYKNTNGKETVEVDFSLPYQSGAISITSSDKQHSFFSNSEFGYVLINGQRVGNYPAMRAWYSKERNAFMWTTLEGRELALYEFKL